MNIGRIIVVSGFALSVALGAVGLGGCATGSGGGLDGPLSLVDSGAKQRTLLRKAATDKHAFIAPLIAAHNLEQDKLPKEQQLKIVEWWLGENNGVHIEAIGGKSMSSVYGDYATLAKKRPEAGTEERKTWEELMGGLVATYRDQADALTQIADHWDKDGTSAQVSSDDVKRATALLRERADLIRGKTVTYNVDGQAITASLDPGSNVKTTTASTKNDSALTQRNVDKATAAGRAASDGNVLEAGRRGVNLVVPK